MKKLTSEAEFNELVNSGKTIVTVFKTTWCKDCHYLDVYMPSIEEAYASKVEFIEIDRDEFPDLSERFTVLGIPSFITFKNGQEVTRLVSKLRKEKAEIEKYLDQSIQVAEALS